ncbi:hypothetical protein D3C85_1364990 [compost metagenome]
MRSPTLTTKSCSEPGMAAPTLPPVTGPVGAVGYCGAVGWLGSIGTAGSTLGLGAQAARAATAALTVASLIRVEVFIGSAPWCSF